MTTQIVFKAEKSFKDEAMRKARFEGVTLKAVLYNALKLYIEGKLNFGLQMSEPEVEILDVTPEIQKENGQNRQSTRKNIDENNFVSFNLKKGDKTFAEILFKKGDIKKHVEKAEKGLATDIKGSTIPNTKLVKVYMTGRGGAGRMIVLIYVKRDYYLPVLVRLKKDKIVGMNLSKGNLFFQDLLNRNLNLIVRDLGEGNFEEL